MKASELAQMSLKDLRVLRDRVDEAIATREKTDRADVKAKLAEIASKAGFSVGELFGNSRGGKRGSAEVKFRNPQNPAETWTGRGRKPKWLAKAGGDIERFRI
jgi:DNA-binding protein H-NS